MPSSGAIVSRKGGLLHGQRFAEDVLSFGFLFPLSRAHAADDIGWEVSATRS